jgi:hypothetical protein
VAFIPSDYIALINHYTHVLFQFRIRTTFGIVESLSAVMVLQSMPFFFVVVMSPTRTLANLSSLFVHSLRRVMSLISMEMSLFAFGATSLFFLTSFPFYTKNGRRPATKPRRKLRLRQGRRSLRRKWRQQCQTTM